MVVYRPVPHRGTPEDAAIGDLNGDGLNDIVAIRRLFHLLFNTPGNPGTFFIRRDITVQPAFGSVAIADLDEDGLNDLAVADNGAKVRFQDPAAPGSFLPAVLVGQ